MVLSWSLFLFASYSSFFKKGSYLVGMLSVKVSLHHISLDFLFFSFHLFEGDSSKSSYSKEFLTGYWENCEITLFLCSNFSFLIYSYAQNNASYQSNLTRASGLSSALELLLSIEEISCKKVGRYALKNEIKNHNMRGILIRAKRSIENHHQTEKDGLSNTSKDKWNVMKIAAPVAISVRWQTFVQCGWNIKTDP